MPRLPPPLLRDAARQHRFLPRLLRECRDLPSAQNELRWLKEHAVETCRNRNHDIRDRGWSTRVLDKRVAQRLTRYVDRRARGEPLQYILGTQPFGDVEILCQKGVLIPRRDTETYTTRVAELLKEIVPSNVDEQRPNLRVLDLCTGTGCISLLLHSMLRPPGSIGSKSRQGPSAEAQSSLSIVGVDISTVALELARENLNHNINQGHLHPEAAHEVSFHQVDLLCLDQQNGNDPITGNVSHDIEQKRYSETRSILGRLVNRTVDDDDTWDVIVSNPPYISPKQYAPGGTTARSVRNHEPKLALVPLAHDSGHSPKEQNLQDSGDSFYAPLLRTAEAVEAKLLVMEVGDCEQAFRVGLMVKDFMHSHGQEALLEILQDDGTVITSPDWRPSVNAEDQSASARAVVAWKGEWLPWRRSTLSGH